jgi:hypothetical protein
MQSVVSQTQIFDGVVDRSNQDLAKGGVKFDSGKARFDLIPASLLMAVATILMIGAQKYLERNWEAGMTWSRPFAALMRHMWAWWNGEHVDQESGKSHLWHAATNLAFLIEYEQRADLKHFDDRPSSAANRRLLQGSLALIDQVNV